MTAKSKRKSKPREKRLDAPFDAGVWRKATQIAGRYKLIIQKEPGLGYLGRSVELPMVMADGKTVASCAAETLEALTGAVATMLEDGRKPPIPSVGEKRSAQINIRLTEEERLRLEDTARRQGFRGVADYMRAVSLRDVGKRSA